MIIPNEIHVGYQSRGDTYTDKLGFVTYKDDLGNLKFEKSWESWRHKPGDLINPYNKNHGIHTDHVKPDIFDNESTTGFILNKNVKRYSSFSNAEYVRVWDPRGFEFEIKIENLLNIILYNGIDKGNEIKGELVYAWDSTNAKKLTLLPVNTEQYKEYLKVKNETKDGVVIEKKLQHKELEVGRKYKTKNNIIIIYMGEFCGKFRISYGNMQNHCKHLVYNITEEKFQFAKTTTSLTMVLDKEDIKTYIDIFNDSTYVKQNEKDEWKYNLDYL
jgi:hypothetical protein